MSTTNETAERAQLLLTIREDTTAIAARATQRDRAIGAAYTAGATLDEIAAVAGCVRETVRSTLHRLGVEVRGRGRR